MRRLRLCFVGPAQNITTRRWVQWFAQQGHEVTLLTVEPADDADVQGFRQVDLRTPSLPRKVGRLLSAIRLAARIRSVDPDLVHIHYTRGLAWGMLLANDRPYVVTPWGSDVLEEQGAFRDWSGRLLTGRTLARADLITVHSRYLEERVRPLVPSRVPLARVGWGVDARQFRSGLDTSSVRRRWGIASHQHVILSPRLMQPFYRHDVILDAFRIVHDTMPDTVLVMPEQFPDEPYVERLRRLVEAYRLTSCVRFVGCIPYAEMPLWLNLARVMVMAPCSDGMPNTLLESMACGAFPVVGRLPQYAEIIESRRNGLLVNPQASDIAEGMLEALACDALRESAAVVNRRWIETNGNQDCEMMHMEEWYRRLSGQAA